MDLRTLDALRWSREKEHCERDFLYLASTYLRIKAKDVIGFPTLKLNRVQQHLWERMHDQWKRTGYVRQVWGKARQIGASTLMRAFNFQQTAFRNNRNALLVTHDEPSSYEMFDIDRTFYDALPPQLRPRARNIAKSRIVFDGRNSKILVGHALNMNVAASQMNHIAHITEAARYRNAFDVQASLFPSISEARGEDPSIVVVESTSVYGGTWFKEFAEAAMRGETEYEFHFIPWYLHSNYQLPVPHDFEPTLEEREWMKKYQLSTENVVWYRATKAKYRARPALMLQEFPFDWESSWQMPEGTLRVFDDDVLESLSSRVCQCLYRAVPSSTGLQRSLGGLVEIWQEPRPDCFYDMGVDVAGGATVDADWSVASVIRRDTLEQVAQMRLHMNPASTDFIDLVYWLGMNYNAAQINPDITGGWGNALQTELQMRSYPAIWQWRRRDDAKGRVSSRMGFLFTKRDKSVLVHNAVALASRGDVMIHSEVLLDEMRAYLNIGLDEWGATHGSKDDAVTAWMLALLSARDDRIDIQPEQQEQKPVLHRAQTKPWSVHDVDADMAAPAQRSFSWLQPWRG